MRHANGVNTLYHNTTGSYNTASGVQALLSNTIGTNNTATGAFALANNNNDSFNTADGAFALFNSIDAGASTAVGYQAAYNNNEGANTAIGYRALYSGGGGTNTAVGAWALYNNASASSTAVGVDALVNSTTGGLNTALGYLAGINVTTGFNVICIGPGAGENVNNSCFISNVRGATTANNDAIPVLIDSAGQLGTMSSSARFKKEIKPMDKASEAVLALKPVTFHYKSDKTNRPEFGLIAEEVAAVNPSLVVRDKNGEIYTVRYDAVNAMLLNEFLKEHRTVQEQKATIVQLKQDFQSKLAEQQEQIEALTAGLHKVSAQLEASKPAPQVVNNP